MLESLEAVESSPYPTFIREAPSLAAYALVSSLHAMGLAVGVVQLGGRLVTKRGVPRASADHVRCRVQSVPVAPFALAFFFPLVFLTLALRGYTHGRAHAAGNERPACILARCNQGQQ